MRRRHDTLPGPGVPSARFAWWVSFLASLAVVALLVVANSAQALPLPPLNAPGPVAAASPFEDEGEAEAETSEEEGLEVEECEEVEAGDCEEADEGLEAPAECVLTSAEATIFASGNGDKVRLQVRYTTTSPTAVTVAYGLHGRRGSLFLGNEKKHLGRKGVLRLNKKLSEEQMAKVMAAKDFTVRLRPLAAPGYCQPFFDRHLTVRRATPRGLSWLSA